MMKQARILKNMLLGIPLAFSMSCATGNGQGAKVFVAPVEVFPAAGEQAGIYKDVPAKIDARARYLFYLHGRIIEDKGAHAVHEKHGAYEYEKILETFRAAGFVVVSEARAKDTDAARYAAKVVGQINALLKAGVAPRSITVVGASKGSGIAMHASSLLKQRDVNFVIMAGCAERTLKNPAINLYGRVLSIYDASDESVGTCESLLTRSEGLSMRKEIKINLGLGHGFLYRPHKEWIDPAIEWAKQS
jgi:hypothetical protein